MNVEAQLTEVFKSVFGDTSIALRRSMTAADVPDWDSLAHINLIVAIEKTFRIRFTTAEVSKLENVGDLMDTIERKLAKNTQN
jgi:acyl carrier protein